ncbi:ergothioneine biosynthesis protein EgtB [Aureibacter tunicatorum]|uniref:Ergothioneine biosynthesis protein EgtB n=1 Tax=Aureibacter tunicatorum TaxID=866807 RepID=A0AAE3XK48_9BACT|nr:ergothioneine biosynthesis protein EgtB [Aureibacter tunicatorum]MDR6237256.1 ergothioneine biosynthesis protein EgtB [Aureibacter tunicatorum]
MQNLISNIEMTLSEEYLNVRKKTLNLCLPLQNEDFNLQAETFVSPPKWHLAHTTWFFEVFILKEFIPNYNIYHPKFEFLFNSYYEHKGKRLARNQRGLISRPSVQEVIAYRKAIDEQMLDLISTTDSIQIQELVTLGLNHEQQHQELLLTDLKYSLFQNPTLPSYNSKENREDKKERDQLELKFINIPAGIYSIGANDKGEFSFDNEKPVHEVYVKQYNIADRLVTNKEYLEFIEDGGYETFKYWLSEGWEWVQNNQIKSPYYWIKDNGKWMEYTLSGLEELDPHAPVTHISYFEAEAFADWAGMSLPSEHQWEIAAKKILNDHDHVHNLLESDQLHPTPAFSSFQFIGDCWEWTQSSYLPYPNFKKAKGALGEYNAKFMINQMVLRGGSCATPESHIRHSYRNFFRPEDRWQFTGIRLCKNSL